MKLPHDRRARCSCSRQSPLRRIRFTWSMPLAITVALIIAAMKGSMVAAVFMHLSHEKRWIYGALLLTVALLHRAHVRAALLTIARRYRHRCRLRSRAGGTRGH